MAQPLREKSDIERNDLPLVVLERVSYITCRAYGNHLSGTKCFAQRKPPTWNIFLEFEDGTVFEAKETCHLIDYERYVEPFEIETRRRLATLISQGYPSIPTRYERPWVI